MNDKLQIPVMPGLWNMDNVVVCKYDLLGVLAKWAVQQSPYLVPVNLQEAICDFSNMWNHIDGTKMSSQDLRSSIYSTIEKCTTTIVVWNNPRKSNHEFAFCSRHGRPEPDYDFIDLDALARNMTHDIVINAQIYQAQITVLEGNI